jgi:hypothetical protein
MPFGSHDNFGPNQGLCEALFFADVEGVQAKRRSRASAIGQMA